MKNVILSLITLYLISACQVKEQVGSSNSLSPNLPDQALRATPSENGWKKLNTFILVSINFSRPLIVTGTPSILMMVGNEMRELTYQFGSGENDLMFAYSVSEEDFDDDGVEFFNQISLTNGAIKFIDEDGVLKPIPNKITFPYRKILVDGSSPKIQSISAPETRTFVSGENLYFELTFDEPVLVNGNPVLYLSIDSSFDPVDVNYVSGSGSNKLLFLKEITSSEADTDGVISIEGSDLVEIPPTPPLISDLAGNILNENLPLSTFNQKIFINPSIPSVSSVSLVAGTYNLGQEIFVDLSFNEEVTVQGYPQLRMTLGSGVVHPIFFEQPSPDILRFRYQVKAGDVSNGVTIRDRIELNNGSIKNATGSSNALLNFTPPDTSGVIIDSPFPLQVLYAWGPAPKTYITGETLSFTLFFNRPVTITGTPRLMINVGGTIVYADYDSDPLISSGQTAVFTYAVSAVSSNLSIVMNPLIDLNGGTIVDSNAVNTQLFFSPPNTSGIKIDGISPSIQNVTIPSDGTYGPNQQLNFIVTMSEPVIVSGNPRIPFEIDGTTVYAQYISGSTTSSLLFRYTISPGNFDMDGINIPGSIDLNGGTIRDLNTLSLSSTSFLVPGIVNILVDGVAPDGIYFSSSSPGNFVLGDNFDITIQFDEEVLVGGAPYIELDLDGAIKKAYYHQASSTSLNLVFRYTIAYGDEADEIDLVDSINPINLAGGYIKDLYGNSATLSNTVLNIPTTFPGIIIDAQPPRIDDIILPLQNNFIAGDHFDIEINWSENVTITGTPQINLQIANLTGTLSYVSAESTPTSSLFRYTIEASPSISTTNLSLLTPINLNGGTIQDALGNNALIFFSPPLIFNKKIDNIAPTIMSLSSPNAGVFQAGQTVKFLVTWSEPVEVVSPANLKLNLDIGGASQVADYSIVLSTPLVAVFEYTIQAGDLDMDGVEATSLTGSDVRDLATNLADLTFSTTIFPDLKIDTLAPNLSFISVPIGYYRAGTNIEVSLDFDEAVLVSGTPYVELLINGITRNAFYHSGSGTSTIVFSYTINTGENDTNGVDLVGQIDLAGGSITDLAGNPAVVSFSSANYVNVIVDTLTPFSSSLVTSINVTRGSSFNHSFIPGNVMEFSVDFNEDVMITGSPRLALTIGNVTRYADYYAAGSTYSVLKFRYTIDAGNALLDLDGLELAPEVNLNGGSIADFAGNEASLSITYDEKDYVYFSNFTARYFIDSNPDTFSKDGSDRITNLLDQTGNGHDLQPDGGDYGPMVFSTGFGTNNRGFMTFDSGSELKNSGAMDVKYAFVVLKTPETISSGTQDFTLINRAYQVWEDDGFGNWYLVDYWDPMITFQSTSTNKSLLFSPNQKVKYNSGNFNSSYVSSLTSIDLWLPNTNYIYIFDLENVSSLEYGSTFGAGGDSTPWNNFEGDVAEIIIIGGSLTEDKLNLIRDQLNTLYGIY